MQAGESLASAHISCAGNRYRGELKWHDRGYAASWFSGAGSRLRLPSPGPAWASRPNRIPRRIANRKGSLRLDPATALWIIEKASAQFCTSSE